MRKRGAAVSVRIGNSVWMVKGLPRSDMGDLDGECLASSKDIHYANNLGGIDRLDAIVHEVLHAANWEAHHRTVNRAAGAISTVLWRLGYRMVEP